MGMVFGWPQIIWVILAGLGIGVAAAKDGEPRGRWSFVSTVIGTAMSAALLWWGGFFGA